MKLWILLLTISVCRAQFSIQGPSDGHRQAAGLKVSQEKGVEYIPHKDIINAGGFTIQGATDGNSQIQGASDGRNDFEIQGATDGNSNFQIQGATDANANFQIQGPTNGGSNSYIQGGYHANQAQVEEPEPVNRPIYREGGRALQYKDPSGLRVNWKSYNQRAQAAPASQYIAAEQQPAAPVQQHRRPVAQPQYQQPRPQQPQQPQYRHQAPTQMRPLDNAPERIKQLLAFQQQIPYVNSIPEQFRYDGLPNAIAQAEQFRQEYPKQVLQQVEANRGEYREQPQEQLEPQPVPRYRTKQRGPARAKRQAPQHGQPQYRRIAAPAQEQLPNYSTNLPNTIQQLLKFQASIPYDIIANRITYKLDKPYVPQPVQQPVQQPQPQYQQPQPQYQQSQQQYQEPQRQPTRPLAPAPNNQYQSQLLTYNQAQASQEYRPRQGPYTNNQAYSQQSQIRPVTERR